MGFGLTTTEPPSIEPLSIASVRAQLAIDGEEFDTWIGEAISEAREATEAYTGRRWLTQTVRLTLPTWPDWLDPMDAMYDADGVIECPVEPVQSVESVKYLDEDKVEQEVDAADLDTWLDHSPPRISPDTDTGEWPDVGEYEGAVRIELVVGYESPSLVPGSAKRAMQVCLTDWFENRSGGEAKGERCMPRAAMSLLDPLRTNLYR